MWQNPKNNKLQLYPHPWLNLWLMLLSTWDYEVPLWQQCLFLIVTQHLPSTCSSLLKKIYLKSNLFIIYLFLRKWNKKWCSSNLHNILCIIFVCLLFVCCPFVFVLISFPFISYEYTFSVAFLLSPGFVLVWECLDTFFLYWLSYGVSIIKMRYLINSLFFFCVRIEQLNVLHCILTNWVL